MQRHITIKVRPEDTLPGDRPALGKAIGDGGSTVLARTTSGSTAAIRHLADEIWWGNLVHALWNG